MTKLSWAHNCTGSAHYLTPLRPWICLWVHICENTHTASYCKNKVYFSSHTPRHLHSCFFNSFWLLCLLLLRGIIHKLLVWAPLSQEFSCGIHPRHARPGLAASFFFPPFLASSSLPLGRKARSWEIKGIARRPHERQHWAAVLNSPERLFQSEQPDRQRQDPQGRGAGRRSLEGIKILGPKFRENLY